MQAIASIQKLSDYDDALDLYTMEVFYDYHIDDLTPVGGLTDQEMVTLIMEQALPTPVLICLVLDRCATTEEAIDLISQYDYMATSGRDYHYYITDASGDGRVVEWGCEKEDRPLVATPLRTITNYYGMYEDKVISGQKNGIYGQGKEGRDQAEAVFEASGTAEMIETARDGVMAASTAPDPEIIISNTQWSIVYDISNLTHEFTLHRHWEDWFAFIVETTWLRSLLFRAGKVPKWHLV